MRDWIKPELVVEEFELSQHVANGCGTPLGNANSTYPKTVYATYEHNGNNKDPYPETFEFSKNNNDTDGDGKIDRSEFEAFYRNVINKPRGGYHLAHYRIDGTTYTDIGFIFNS